MVRFAMAPCHVCDSPRPETVHAATRLLGLVSSDVLASGARVDWAVCPRCGTIQKVIDRDWHLQPKEAHEARRRA